MPERAQASNIPGPFQKQIFGAEQPKWMEVAPAGQWHTHASYSGNSGACRLHPTTCRTRSIRPARRLTGACRGAGGPQRGGGVRGGRERRRRWR